ncbi:MULTISPECIES: hypothetical protein [Bradyrhizobium]|uniref:hypothetical protein n=1 Tax=Bradyrhizobium TaxID=374 RepID=UPI0012FF3217|nr:MULTISPECIES: hypothetical protein [Bradyrhizobium]
MAPTTFAVDDQQVAAARGDHVVERREIGEGCSLSHQVFERQRGTPIARRGVRLVLGNAAMARQSVRSPDLGTHECEVCVGVAIVGNEAKLRLDVGDAPVFKVFRNDEAEQRTAESVVIQSGGLCICKCR